MSHMIADTEEELHQMAEQIGLKPEWFQNKGVPHYDICQAKKKQAIQQGAIEVDRRRLVRIIKKLKSP